MGTFVMITWSVILGIILVGVFFLYRKLNPSPRTKLLKEYQGWKISDSYVQGNAEFVILTRGENMKIFRMEFGDKKFSTYTSGVLGNSQGTTFIVKK